MPASDLGRLEAILACPECRSDVSLTAKAVKCSGCGRSFSVQQSVPVFLEEPAEVALEHASNTIGEPFNTLLREGKDFILHIGAGGSPMRYPNCVEFEHKIFRHTDVVGDAH